MASERRYNLDNKQVNKIISMVIKDLRNNGCGYMVDTIKKADYYIDYCGHDNWNGGIDYYNLKLYLDYSEFSKVVSKKKEYEDAIEASLHSFYNDENEVINGVSIESKIDYAIDWEAIAPKENKESVIKLLEKEKETLIAAGTGIIQIKGTQENKHYKEKHAYICGILKSLCLDHVNPYDDLWSWYSDYNTRELKTYQSRRIFIRDMYEPLLATIRNSDESSIITFHYEPTGWDKIDESVARMKEVLDEAQHTADYQSVGMHGRELLISLAQVVFDKDKHPSVDGVDIGSSDSKRMLEAYINYCMKHKSREREVKFAKAANDFSNELTHNRTASAMDAELCYNAVVSTVHIIHILNKYND